MESAITVLLVEDDKSVRAVLSSLLEVGGFRVLQAGSPHDAFRLIRSHRGEIHLLIADMILPKSSGADLARKVLTHFQEIKVLFLSGYPPEQFMKNRALPAGSVFLQKPVTMEVLLRTIRELLDLSARGA